MNATPRRLRRIALAAAALALLVGPVAADDGAACDGKPLVVKIHADWCGTCKAQKEIWSQAETELSGEATLVKLDVTDRAAFEASQSEAERLGIADFFAEYRRRTGTIAVLACHAQEPVALLTTERDIAKFHEAIAKVDDPS